MNLNRKSRIRLTVALLSPMVVGCSGGTLSSVGAPGSGSSTSGASTAGAVRAFPKWLHSSGERWSPRVLAPTRANQGIYVSSFDGTEIVGFGVTGKGPRCTVDTGKDAYVNDIATDPHGNLVVPLGGFESVAVYSGPAMCGAEAGSFIDPYGQPANAASLNALRGTIAVANIVGPGSSAGNIAICTMKDGCTKELTNPNITGYAGGIAMAKNGDCWLTSERLYSYYVAPPAMTYWKGCTGAGEAVTGYQNEAYGSISIDSHGYVVALDLGAYYHNSQLWVYKGCNPDCELIGGPFPLHGREVFGGLNKKSNEYGVTEYIGASYPYTLTDIYKYSPTTVAYKYSFRNYLNGDGPEGFAFNTSPK